MSDSAVVVNISDMIDLAIGTPEVGVVDFNMLQMVLHCLAQQLRVLGKTVELRGSLTALPVNRDNAQTIAISEFVVETDKTKKAPYKEVKDTGHAIPAEESILVVERVKKKDSPISKGQSVGASSGAPSATSAKAGAGAPGAGAGTQGAGAGAPDAGAGAPGAGAGAPGAGAGAPGAGATAPEAGAGALGAGAGAPSAGAGAPSAAAGGAGVERRLSLVTLSKFNVLETTVEDLQKRVYGSVPKNEEILQEVRSQTNLKAITDMWTNLNVSARLEAAENGIAKLSSLVQDLIGETADLQRSSKVSTATTGKPSRTSTPTPHKSAGALPLSAGGSTPGGLETGGGTSSAGFTPPPSRPPMAPSAAPGEAPKFEDLQEIYDQLNHMQNDLNDMNKTFLAALNDVAGRIGEYPQSEGGNVYNGGDEVTPSQEVPAAVGGEGGGGGQPPAGGGKVAGGRVPAALGGGGQQVDISGLTDKLNNLERRLKECYDNVSRSYGMLMDQINSVENQVEEVMRHQMSGAVDPNAAAGNLSPDLVKDLKGLMQLFTTVQEMQAQLAQVHDTALNLAAEKEDRQHHTNALLEQIELLKVVKMDREDMAEAMAEKADLRALARKVSHDQFEMACDDLSRGLEHAIGKLNMQEALWQQALDDIQREIETKLDKMELSPVKEFFNNKLRQLQENLKQMAELRREAEAAGTKRRLLRDVNCISCDAKAVMAMDPSVALPVSKPLPPTLSMKPYLSYELDTIRKAQATSVPQRNMHDWETIDKQMNHPKAPHKVRSETDKHLCNRYCGGSHTVTTPAQRVARLGHFVKQWGPDVLPLSSGLAAGDDGKMYKVTTTENANVGPGGAVDTTCTPRMPKKSEIAKPPAKPMVISAECGCLEGDKPQGKQ